MQTNLLPRPHPYPPPWSNPQKPYIKRLVEAFLFVLSPQALPHDKTARQCMDEELWMPLRVLSKLPILDALYISELMLPYVTSILDNYARDVIQVDITRQMIRPRWALCSSVFICDVDPNATTEQVFALLDDIRYTFPHRENPYAYCNVTITQQAATAWTIGFKSPNAGAYAAMAMKSKCINGAMILPMACMHMNPPRASYGCAGIVVMEIDAMQYGDPVIPNDLVPFYSSNAEHLSLLYNATLVQHQNVPTYEEYFHGSRNISYGYLASNESTALNTSEGTDGRIGSRCERDSRRKQDGMAKIAATLVAGSVRYEHRVISRGAPATSNTNAAEENERPEVGHYRASNVRKLSNQDLHEGSSQPRAYADPYADRQSQSAKSLIHLETDKEVTANVRHDLENEELKTGRIAPNQAKQILNAGNSDSTDFDAICWDAENVAAIALQGNMRKPKAAPPSNVGDDNESSDSSRRGSPKAYADVGRRNSARHRIMHCECVNFPPSLDLTNCSKAGSLSANLRSMQQGDMRLKDFQEGQERQQHRRESSCSPADSKIYRPFVNDATNGSNTRRKHRKLRDRDSRNGSKGRHDRTQSAESGRHSSTSRLSSSHSDKGKTSRRETLGHDGEWQVISYRKPLRRRLGGRGSVSSGSSGERDGRRETQGKSRGTNSVA